MSTSQYFHNAETFDKTKFDLKVGERKDPNGAITYHGSLKFRKGKDQVNGRFCPKHMVRVSAMRRGKYDKDYTRSVLISFAPSYEVRGQVYEVEGATESVDFLNNVLVPYILERASVKNQDLGIQAFDPKNVTYGDLGIMRRQLIKVGDDGVPQLFAKVRIENYKDKDKGDTGSGRYVARRPDKNGQMVPIADSILSKFDVYGIIHYMTFELNIKDGRMSLNVTLGGIDVADAAQASDRRLEEISKMVSAFATEDLDDLFAEAEEAIEGDADAAGISPTFGAAAKMVDPSEMVAQ